MISSPKTSLQKRTDARMFATRRVTAEIFSTIDVPPREWQYVQHRSRRRASKGWGRYQPCKASCSSSVGIRGRTLAYYRHSPADYPRLLDALPPPAGLARQFIVNWFDHTQPSPLLPMASTGHPSMASLQSASSSGVVGCLNT